MYYLIDGYNLMHVMGLMGTSPFGPDGLLRARLGLLGFLKAHHQGASDYVTVVFDARAPCGDLPSRVEYDRIEVRFATHQAEADDLIEDLIRTSSTPRKLTVVSDDRRIQEAARRRRCLVAPCQSYLQGRERQRKRPRPATPPPVKPTGSSRADTSHWLAEFGDLANDPAFGEISTPIDFLDLPNEKVRKPRPNSGTNVPEFD